MITPPGTGATSTPAPAPVPGSAVAVPPAPRWAVVAAHVAALTPLPSAIWRFALVFGNHGGYTEQGYANMNMTGWGGPWVVFLSLSTELAALLTLGLVRPWGERPPRWVPFVGGRRMNPVHVTRVAYTGVVILVLLWTQFLFWWAVPHDDMTDSGGDLLGVLYQPLVWWAPLLAAVTWSYRRRHLGEPARGGAE
ncbi:hypothetical protein OG948_28670 [Embleya sp. NBC_00888]|uniref:hypothetical protein n=1 Tax=Embleya sp. NBC_00888 TaxID=2975960 RepID=UPI003870C397|nr:hypothetical protein OG948_28670 [Embleya sp. NBC_00888]